MNRELVSRWSGPVAVLVAVAAVLAFAEVGPVAWIAVMTVAVITAWRVSPLNGGSGSTHRQAVDRAGSGGVVIYWRPGCMYCGRLKMSLGSDRGRAVWVNIWSDPEAAAFVRSVNDGNETVPTVVVGADTVWTNPPPQRVRDALAPCR